MSVRSSIHGTNYYNVPAAGILRARNTAYRGRTNTAFYNKQTGSRANTRIINVQPISLGFNGLPITRGNGLMATGFFKPDINISNRAFNPCANIKNSSRLNNDYRRFRGGYLYNFPQYLGYNNFGNSYAFGCSYPFALGTYGTTAFPVRPDQLVNCSPEYSIPLNQPVSCSPEYSIPLNQPVNCSVGYPIGYPTYATPCTLNNPYPITSPECAPFLNCQCYANPNDCRSCVAAQGGGPHCADQICGPHVV